MDLPGRGRYVRLHAPTRPQSPRRNRHQLPQPPGTVRRRRGLRRVARGRQPRTALRRRGLTEGGRWPPWPAKQLPPAKGRGAHGAWMNIRTPPLSPLKPIVSLLLFRCQSASAYDPLSCSQVDSNGRLLFFAPMAYDCLRRSRVWDFHDFKAGNLHLFHQ
jgi:hypothetical protein